MAHQTAVEWLINEIENKGEAWENVSIRRIQISIDVSDYLELKRQAKQMEKEQMIEFAEFVASYPDKNRNYEGDILHAKSKYDSAERTVDLLEEYYNETYKKQ